MLDNSKLISKIENLANIVGKYSSCRNLKEEILKSREIIKRIVYNEINIFLIGIPKNKDLFEDLLPKKINADLLFKKFRYTNKVSIEYEKNERVEFIFKNKIKRSKENIKRIKDKLENIGIENYTDNDILYVNSTLKNEVPLFQINEDLSSLIMEEEVVDTIKIFVYKENFIINKVVWLPKIDDTSFEKINNLLSKNFMVILVNHEENNAISLIDDILKYKKQMMNQASHYFIIDKDLTVKNYSEYENLEVLLEQDSNTIHRFKKEVCFDFDNFEKDQFIGEIKRKIKKQNKEARERLEQIFQKIKQCKIMLVKPSSIAKDHILYNRFLIDMSDLIRETNWEDRDSINESIEKLRRMVRNFNGDIEILMNDFARENFKKIKMAEYMKLDNKIIFRLFLSMLNNLILSISKASKENLEIEPKEINDITFIDCLLDNIKGCEKWD